MELSPRGAVPIALPFDDEGDLPVPFTLTAAARRALDPTDVPTLRVVPDRPAATRMPDAPGPAAAPDDLRPAQARALRRSGMRVATIAAAMDVDPALVTAWTVDVAPAREAPSVHRAVRAPGRDRGDRRAIARTGALGGTGLAAAAGVAVALARIDADGSALTLTDDRPDVLAAALGAIRAEATLPAGSVRVAARTGPAVAADRLRADLVRTLGVPAERVVVGRWQGPTDPDVVEVRVRISAAAAVRVVDAWAADVMASADPAITRPADAG